VAFLVGKEPVVEEDRMALRPKLAKKNLLMKTKNYQTKFNLRVLISDTFDPWFNIATEDWIFRDMLTPSEIETTNILFLWRNDNTVVIGRFQNPWSECNIQKWRMIKLFWREGKVRWSCLS